MIRSCLMRVSMRSSLKLTARYTTQQNCRYHVFAHQFCRDISPFELASVNTTRRTLKSSAAEPPPTQESNRKEAPSSAPQTSTTSSSTPTTSTDSSNPPHPPLPRPPHDLPAMPKLERVDTSKPLTFCAAIDFSPSSLRALQETIALINKRRGDRVLVVSVPNIPVVTPLDWEYFDLPQLTAESYASTVSAMEKLKPQLEEQLAGYYTAEVTPVGDPRDVLVEYLKEREASYVVVGKKGLSRVLEALTGSVTNYLIRYSPCSVIVVR